MSEDRLTFSVEEAALVLGISRNAAYAAVQRGALPSIRVGRRVLVPRIALQRMLDDCSSGKEEGGMVGLSVRP